MSGVNGNKDLNYLSYFELKPESNVNDKLAKFFSAIINTYLDIKSKLANNPNYVYDNEDQVYYLTELRNDILMHNPDLIPDYIKRRYDFICIKTKEKGSNKFNLRYMFSYYSDKLNNDELFKRIIEDIIPYLYPQEIKKAIESFRKIDKLELCKFVESFIMLWIGERPEDIINILKRERRTSDGKLLAFYNPGIRYIGGWNFAANFIFYGRNGVDFANAFSKDLVEEGFWTVDGGKLTKDEERVFELYNEKHNSFIEELATTKKTILSNVDCKTTIIIPDMDLPVQFNKEEPSDIIPFVKDLSREDGSILVEVENNNRFIRINIQTPDSISNWQRQVLEVIKEELQSILNERKSSKKKKVMSGSFLDAEEKQEAKALMESESIANIKNEIGFINLIITEKFKNKSKA